MEKEKFLQSIKETLEAAGFSVDDLVQYCAEKETVKAEDIAQRFAFEVMYEGMVRSWVPLEGKEPLGVIFENHLITLHDSSRTMPWRKAMEYCREIKIEGHACSAGKIEFWKKVMNSRDEQKKALDNLLISLGGEALVRKWFWSSSEYSSGYAWFFCTDSNYGAKQGGVVYYSKDYTVKRVVRPVLDLSKLSL